MSRLPIRVQYACAYESGTNYYCLGHIPHCRPTAGAQTHHKEACNDEILTRFEYRIYQHTIDRYDKEQTSPITSLEAQWPVEQASQRRTSVSMATLICAHSTTIPTNLEPSKLVAEHIFCVFW